MFSPDVLGPTVDFLAALAGDGAAVEFGIGTGRVALPLAQRGVPRPGHRPLRSDGRQAPREAGRRAGPDDDRRLRDNPRRRDVLARLPRLQHDLQPDRPRTTRSRASRTLQTTWSRAALFVIEVSVRPTCSGSRPPSASIRSRSAPDHIGLDEYDVANQGARLPSPLVGGRRLAQNPRSPSATRGRQSSTSWPAWPGCSYASVGGTGTARRSRARAASTCPSGSEQVRSTSVAKLNSRAPASGSVVDSVTLGLAGTAGFRRRGRLY